MDSKAWWQRFREWWTVNRHAKRGLTVGEVFYRLAGWQRWILIVGCLLIAAFWISMPYSVSVMPHWFKLRNADGTFNAGELSTAIGLTGTVFYMALYEFILKSKDVSLIMKIGGAALVALCMWTNSGTGTATQTVAHDQRNGDAARKNARIEILKQQIADNTAAWNGSTKPAKRTTKPMVDTVTKAAAALEKSADEECHRAVDGVINKIRGVTTAGPKCADLERRRDRKNEELTAAQGDKDATDNLVTIEAALGADKAELKELGPKAEHTDELNGFILFLTNFGLSQERAKSIVANKPATDTLNFEFLACFGVAPCIMLWIRFMAFLTCQTGEAEERVKEVMGKVAEQHAKKALDTVPDGIVLTPPKAAPFWNEPEEMEPDHEAALGIIGKDLPAFAENPEGDEEVMAAACLKAAGPRKRRAPKLTKAHKSSVVQWHKERCFAVPGRHTWSDEAITDYKAWCEDLNLEPVNPTVFGLVFKNELKIGKEKVGNRVKYLDVGLRAAGLKLVSGG